MAHDGTQPLGAGREWWLLCLASVTASVLGGQQNKALTVSASVAVLQSTVARKYTVHFTTKASLAYGCIIFLVYVILSKIWRSYVIENGIDRKHESVKFGAYSFLHHITNSSTDIHLIYNQIIFPKKERKFHKLCILKKLVDLWSRGKVEVIFIDDDTETIFSTIDLNDESEYGLYSRYLQSISFR